MASRHRHVRAALLVASALLVAVVGAQPAQNPVAVCFYGESLCPDCTAFVTGPLKRLFTDGISLLTDFRYIGWGNVRESGDSYECQHGPVECTMNTVLNCAQAQSTTQEQFFNFLFCIESQAGPESEAQVPGCAKAAGLPLKRLEDCYKGEEGRKLTQAARNATDSLKPAHTYVPWVTVNGVPLFEDVNNIATYICVAYNGSKPEACYSPPHAGNGVVGFSQAGDMHLS